MGNALTELRIHGDTAVRPYGDIFGTSGFTEAVDPSPLGEIAREVFAAEIEAARRTGNLGYMARVLSQVTLPHSRPTGTEYVRRNGNFSLSILAPSDPGLPYGGVPRIVLAWLTTEAVRTRERRVVLGKNLSKFMGQIGLVPT